MARKGILWVVRLFLCGVWILEGAAIHPLGFEEMTYAIGEEDAWQEVVALNDLQYISGKRGYPDLAIAEAAPTEGAETDLLITFDRPNADFGNDRYQVIEDSDILRGAAYYGEASGLFNYGQGIALESISGSTFSSATDGQSFSIQFWLRDSHGKDNEVILRWHSSADDKEGSERMAMHIAQGRAVWDFENIFYNRAGNAENVALRSAEKLSNKVWQHHLLNYNAQIGALLYYIDGQLSAARYLTDTATEAGAPFSKIIRAQKGTLIIGEHFNGALDHLVILRASISPLSTHYYRAQGMAETDVIDLAERSGRIVRIDHDATIPPHTEIMVEYRVFRSAAEIQNKDRVSWRSSLGGVDISDPLYVQYIQLRITLKSDGVGGATPILSNITLHLERIPAPLPARNVIAIPRGTGSISIQWEHPYDLTPTYYYVTYGKSPRQFTHRIDTKNNTSIIIDSLAKDTLYYFRVESYRNEIPGFAPTQSALISSRTE